MLVSLASRRRRHVSQYMSQLSHTAPLSRCRLYITRQPGEGLLQIYAGPGSPISPWRTGVGPRCCTTATPLALSAWAHALADHLDRQFADYILKGIASRM